MSNAIKTLLLAAMLSMSSVVASAGPFEDANAAYERQDYATALKLWRPLADQGDASSQYNLAVMNEKGQGVEKDYLQAHIWYDIALKYFPLTAIAERNQAAKARARMVKKMTAAQIAKALKLAREWKPSTGPK